MTAVLVVSLALSMTVAVESGRCGVVENNDDRNAMMRIVLVGGNGYIGSALAQSLRQQSRNVFAISRTADKDGVCLNLANPADFDYDILREGDCVVLTAAVSSPDVCCRETAMARQVNVDGSAIFIRRCLERQCRVLFFSSDTVYGASNSVDPIVFVETSSRNPVGLYGAMKKEIEDMFLGKPGFCSLRLSYVVSLTDKFTSYLVSCGQHGREAEIFHPFRRSVIGLKDVVAAVGALSDIPDTRLPSACNLCGPQCLSREEIAVVCREVLCPDLQWRLVRPDSGFYAARPEKICLESLYLTDVLGRSPAGIREEYLSDK